jgi:Condensation domain
VAGKPVQIIAPTRPLKLPVIDLTGMPAPQREAEALRLATADARRPFDLTRDLLLRPSLLRLGPADHVLVQTMHHVASDGWSIGILAHELAALYAAARTGSEPRLSPLPIQYADYAVWQRQWLQGDVLEEQLAYWKHQLAGLPARLELPADRPRPPTQRFRGALHWLAMPPELGESVLLLSRREEVTPFMVLLAAFQALLYGWTGQEDIAVGSPMAGRTRTAFEGLIGFFANTLVLRTDLGGTPTFRELLGRVREVVLGAHAHQEVPFEKLVEALRPPRDPSRNPLVQVNFRVQTAEPPYLQLAGLDCEPLRIDPGTARFDMAADVWLTAAGLKGYIEYSTDLFEAETIVRLAGDFEGLLRAVTGRPEARLSELDAFRTICRRDRPAEAGAPARGYRNVQRKAVELS